MKRSLYVLWCYLALTNQIYSMDMDDKRPRYRPSSSPSSEAQQSSFLLEFIKLAGTAIGKIGSYLLQSPKTSIDTVIPTSSRTLAPASIPSTQHASIASTLDQQITSFLATCCDTGDTSIALIERGHLEIIRRPATCLPYTELIDEPLLLGLVRAGTESGVAYISVIDWAHAIVQSGIERAWRTAGLDPARTPVNAIRIYTQQAPRIFILQEELPMTTQSQRETFMPAIIAVGQTAFEALLIAEGIEPDRFSTLSQEQQDQLQRSHPEVRVDELAHEHAAIPEIQRETCDQWAAQLVQQYRQTPAHAHNQLAHIHALREKIEQLAHKEDQPVLDQLDALMRSEPEYSAIARMADSEDEHKAIMELAHDIDQAIQTTRQHAQLLWEMLQATHRSIISLIETGDLLEAESRAAQWRHTYLHRLGTISDTYGIGDAHELVQYAHDIDEALAQANFTAAGISPHDIEAARRTAYGHH